MKIGILTFHTALNYGAIFQAIGLTEYLRANNHDAEIIDYRPHAEFLSLKNRSFLRKIRRLIGIVLSFIPNKILKYKFDKFNKIHLHTSREILCVPSQIPLNYDVYIIGSDQVWNKKLIHHDAHDIFLGNFNRPAASKLISYAASAGNGEALLDSAEFSDTLTRYDAISVREKTLQDFLKNRFNTYSQVVIDPTLLIDENFWINKASSQNDKPYILIYLVNRSDEARKIIRWAKQIAKQKNLALKFIPSQHYIFNYKWYKFPSPQDFLNLFFNASYVITTSFHGCCFSVIFKKTFYALSFGDKNENRINTLLSTLNLEDRRIKLDANIEFEKINYDMVYKELNSIRTESRNFLNINLKQ